MTNSICRRSAVVMLTLCALALAASMRILRGSDMNVRPQFLACIFGITVLSGCGNAPGPIDLALAPIVLPTMYAIQRSGVVQPVTVVSSSGEQLTPESKNLPPSILEQAATNSSK